MLVQECRHAVVVRVIVAVAAGGEVRALPCRAGSSGGTGGARLSGTQSIHSLPLHTVTVTTPPLTSQKPVSGREPRGRHVGGRQPPHGRVHDPLKLKPSHQSRSQAATAGRPSLMGGSKLSGGRRRSEAAYTL